MLVHLLLTAAPASPSNLEAWGLLDPFGHLDARGVSVPLGKWGLLKCLREWCLWAWFLLTGQQEQRPRPRVPGHLHFLFWPQRQLWPGARERLGIQKRIMGAAQVFVQTGLPLGRPG